MAADDIPSNVRAFLIDNVESVVQVEVLLMLHGNPGRSYAAVDVSSELRVELPWARAQLANWAARGVLREVDNGVYRWAPRTAQIDDAVAGLARAYADRRVTVIGLIYANPTDQLRSFADAFRIRKDPGNG